MILIYLIFLLRLTAEARHATETLDQRVISYRNYGLYFRPQRAIRPINHRWLHTFVIDIPELPPFREHQQICVTGQPTEAEGDDTPCNTLFEQAIHDTEHQAYRMLNQTYYEFKQAFQTSVSDIHSVRTRRAWIDIIGKGLKVAFGLTTTEDLDNVYSTIKEVRRNQAEGFQAVANMSAKLVSFMRLTQNNFDTIFQTFSTYNKMTDMFNKQLSLNRNLIAALGQHMVLTLQQSVEFSMELYHITQFRIALQSALNGRITPDLIPPSIIQLTINALATRLATLQTPLFLVTQTPQAVYSGHDFTLW